MKPQIEPVSTEQLLTCLGLAIAEAKLVRSCFTNPGDPTSAAFVLFNTISTKPERYANHAEIMESKPAKDSAKHLSYLRSK